MSEWCERIAQAKASGKNIPEAQLFRRMLWHEFWRRSSDAADVFCEADLLPPGEEAPEPMSGLQLAGTVDAKKEMRVHYAPDAPPLILSVEEVDHFRSFVPITVVEGLLQRLHDGEDLQVDAPCARLREFDGFLTVCAGGQGQPASEGDPQPATSPLKMALAPDAEGRKLAAAFTSQDALQLFVVSKESARGSDGALLLSECGWNLVAPASHPESSSLAASAHAQASSQCA